MWVAETARGKGLGRQVMLAIEDAAEERGCERARLDTFSYQARPFYEKLKDDPVRTRERGGYEVPAASLDANGTD